MGGSGRPFCFVLPPLEGATRNAVTNKLSKRDMNDSKPTNIQIRKLADCPEFAAGDNTRLRELFNPHNHTEFTGQYSLAHATLAPGKSSLPHRLNSHELYYIISGSGRMHIDDSCADVFPGDAIEIPPAASQWIENTTDSELRFLCIVDPAWRAEDESIELTESIEPPTSE
jgi:mannose-6-phosphate isomerase-like protein (cupin superfamily)